MSSPLQGLCNIEKGVRAGLCAGCGTCFSACSLKAIRLTHDRRSGLIRPDVDEDRCVHCGVCADVCPGVTIPFKRYTMSHCPSNHDNLCNASEAWVSYSNNDGHLTDASSGGVLTEILIRMFDQGLVDGAIVTSPLKGPFQGFSKPFIAKTEQELLKAQGSKYCPTAMNSIIGDVISGSERLAYVGLPCHVAGLRALQATNSVLRTKIPYVLGLFCSRTPRSLATFWLLSRIGVQPSEVVELRYRGGGHPGQFRTVLTGSREIKISHLDWRYWGFAFARYFKPTRCWLCPDHSGLLADASFADNWVPNQGLENANKGASTVIVRSEAMHDIFDAMICDRLVNAVPIEIDKVVAWQNLAEKCNVGPRFLLWGGVMRNPLPRYDGAPRPQAFQSHIFREVIDLVRMSISSRLHVALTATIALDYRVSRIRRKIIKGARTIIHGAGYVTLFARALVPQRWRSEKTSKFKILLMGGYGWKDIGDEAMPRADVLNFRKKFPDLRELSIVMLSPNPVDTQAVHGEMSIQDLKGISAEPDQAWRLRARTRAVILLFLIGAYAQRIGVRLRLTPSMRELLDELSTSDLLFNVGGGNLNSVMPSELFKKCTLYRAARILGKPIIVSGQTIGPFYRNSDRRYARRELSRTHLITLRDKEVSRQRLQEIGVKGPWIIDTADDAMTLPGVDLETARALLSADVPQAWARIEAPIMVAMNLKGSMGIFKGQGREAQIGHEIELMAQLADRLIERFSAKILFVPTDYSQGVDDRPLHRAICEYMRNRERAACIQKEFDCMQLKGIIALSDVAIGARYHFNVFAAAECVPFLGMASGLYQMTKLKGLADLCGLPECFETKDLEQCTIDEIWGRAERVVSDRAAIRRKIEKVVPDLKRRSLTSTEYALKILSSPHMETTHKKWHEALETTQGNAIRFQGSNGAT